MGKKRFERIAKIVGQRARNICHNKRKRGLLKKTVELSLLCDLRIFTFIYDKNSGKATQFASHDDIDFGKIMSIKCQREHVSNKDYGKFGGNVSDLDSELAAQIQKYQESNHTLSDGQDSSDASDPELSDNFSLSSRSISRGKDKVSESKNEKIYCTKPKRNRNDKNCTKEALPETYMQLPEAKNTKSANKSSQLESKSRCPTIQEDPNKIPYSTRGNHARALFS